jgi:hypothetical protein
MRKRREGEVEAPSELWSGEGEAPSEPLPLRGSDGGEEKSFHRVSP